MPKITLNLSDEAAAAVQRRVIAGEVASPDAYVDAVIRAAEEPEVLSPEMERHLMEGIRSGRREATPEAWAELRAEVARRIERARETDGTGRSEAA